MTYKIQNVNTFLDAEAPTVSVHFALPPGATWSEALALLSRIGSVLEPTTDPLRAAAVPAATQPTSKPALAAEVVDDPPPKKGKRKPDPEPEPVEAETEDEDDEPVAPPPKKGKKIALTDEMRAMKFRDLITHLINVVGIKSKRELVKWCTSNVDEVPSLGKIAAKGDMTDRINSTAEFVDPDMDD